MIRGERSRTQNAASRRDGAERAPHRGHGALAQLIVCRANKQQTSLTCFCRKRPEKVSGFRAPVKAAPRGAARQSNKAGSEGGLVASAGFPLLLRRRAGKQATISQPGGGGLLQTAPTLTPMLYFDVNPSNVQQHICVQPS